MKKLLSLLVHPVTLGVLGLLALSALVWWAGPLVAFGESRPLDSTLSRVAVLAVLWLLGASRLAWALLKRRRANAALLKGMGAGPSAVAKEEAVLQERFEQALQLLRKAPGSKAGVLQGGASLYELPWYVFVGAPGSGKTTALLNAGLNFPLADKLGQASVRGVGGTRNCEWWFTNEAVLVDTAGRYATQDSDKDTDAAAWGTFLDLLRKAVANPADAILITDLEGRVRHWNAAFARLWHLPEHCSARHDQGEVGLILHGSMADAGTYEDSLAHRMDELRDAHGGASLRAARGGLHEPQSAPAVATDRFLLGDGRTVERRLLPQYGRGLLVGWVQVWRDLTAQVADQAR